MPFSSINMLQKNNENNVNMNMGTGASVQQTRRFSVLFIGPIGLLCN